MKYNFIEIEKKWQRIFSEKKPFSFENVFDEKGEKRDSKKKKFYALEMYPYPSGNLHIGHIRNYSIGDALARFKRLKGYDVLHPIGWDAFGLPAENAAIENKIHPAKWTFKNIDAMRSQLQKFGFSYDYDNEVCAAKPDYYKWGQWFFLKMYDMGLVYRKKATVNWDPIDKTVLAKEQVHEGKAWRSGATVQQKQIEQWYFKISNYAEELLNELDNMDEWPEKVKVMQRNWIGKSEGVVVDFIFAGKPFPIYTTRVDTIFGAKFMGLAFDHPKLEEYILDNAELREKVSLFKEKCQNINQSSDYEKEGIFLGTYVKNPASGEEVPIYVTNFVLAEYGTGAIMGCPAHDERDLDFALKYNLGVREVVRKVADTNSSANPSTNPSAKDEKGRVYKGAGELVNSGKYDGLDNELAKEVITKDLAGKGMAKKVVNYRLKDWLISRQRYWGNPIPMLKDDVGNYYPEDLENLPVYLPDDVEFSRSGNPLATSKSFVKVTRNKDGEDKVFFRETDTMDTFTCSSWYFLRYVDTKNLKEPFSKNKVDYYLPVDHYIGGIEHACMHLLYARFFHKVIRDMGLLKSDEPFKRLTNQGMVVSFSYFSPTLKKYYAKSSLVEDETKCPETGTDLVIKKEKMSKSKLNGVNLEELLERYSADSIRLFILFAAPIEKDLEWNEKGLEGCTRFLMKVIKWFEAIKSLSEFIEKPSSQGSNLGQNLEHNQEQNREKIMHLESLINQTIFKVENDIERMHYNTVISHLMIFINDASKITFTEVSPDVAQQIQAVLIKFLILLSPFAPFLSEEIFSYFKASEFLCHQEWPTYDPRFLKKSESEIVIQINGKIRAKLKVSNNLKKEEVMEKVKQEKNVLKYIDNKKVVKEIFVPSKLVSFVVKD